MEMKIFLTKILADALKPVTRNFDNDLIIKNTERGPSKILRQVRARFCAILDQIFEANMMAHIKTLDKSAACVIMQNGFDCFLVFIKFVQLIFYGLLFRLMTGGAIKFLLKIHPNDINAVTYDANLGFNEVKNEVNPRNYII